MVRVTTTVRVVTMRVSTMRVDTASEEHVEGTADTGASVTQPVRFLPASRILGTKKNRNCFAR